MEKLQYILQRLHKINQFIFILHNFMQNKKLAGIRCSKQVFYDISLLSIRCTITCFTFLMMFIRTIRA